MLAATLRQPRNPAMARVRGRIRGRIRGRGRGRGMGRVRVRGRVRGRGRVRVACDGAEVRHEERDGRGGEQDAEAQAALSPVRGEEGGEPRRGEPCWGR